VPFFENPSWEQAVLRLVYTATYRHAVATIKGQVVKLNTDGKVIPTTADNHPSLGVVYETRDAPENEPGNHKPIMVVMDGHLTLYNGSAATIIPGASVKGILDGAIAATTTTGDYVIGMATEEIPAGTWGRVYIQQGRV